MIPVSWDLRPKRRSPLMLAAAWQRGDVNTGGDGANDLMRLAQVPAENFHRSHAVVAMLLVDEGNKLGEKSHRSRYSFAAVPLRIR
jgi:hypothetical protein